MINPAIQSTLESMRAIHTIVLALAIGEAFKQFVADKEEQAGRTLHWDRVPALLAFLFLAVPFYHGMWRYFFEAYAQHPPPTPYGVWLLFDCIAFTAEAAMFFVLSRALRPERWWLFYTGVAILVGIDLVWCLFVGTSRAPCIWEWICLDSGSLVIFGTIFFSWRGYKPTAEAWRYGPALVPALLVMMRTGLDYRLNYSFYFPPETIASTSGVAATDTAQSVAANSKLRRVYFAGPLFSQAEWQWNKQLAEDLRKLNFEVLLPQAQAEPMLLGTAPFDPQALFVSNTNEIERADFIVAILDGADSDSGTSWECGYARKAGRPVIGVRTDIRRAGDDTNVSVNLMLSRSCTKLIQVPSDRINDPEWVAQKISEAAKAIH